MKKVLIIVGSILVLIAALTTSIVVKRNQKINEYREKISQIIQKEDHVMDSIFNAAVDSLNRIPEGASRIPEVVEHFANHEMFDYSQIVEREIDSEIYFAESEGLSFAEVRKGISRDSYFDYMKKLEAITDSVEQVKIKELEEISRKRREEWGLN